MLTVQKRVMAKGLLIHHPTPKQCKSSTRILQECMGFRPVSTWSPWLRLSGTELLCQRGSNDSQEFPGTSQKDYQRTLWAELLRRNLVESKGYR